MADEGPTVAKRRLGKELETLRGDLTQEEASSRTDRLISKNTLSKYESGTRLPRPGYLRLLCNIYKAPLEKREELLALQKLAGKRGWWHDYQDAIGPWFEVYVGLEADASSVRNFNTTLIPGLVQTEAYYRALMASSAEPPSGEVAERMVSVRRTRQDRLTADAALECWLVISEAAINTVKAMPAELASGQFTKLLTVGRLPGVTLQILPTSVGLHPGMDGAFSILSLPGWASDVVYTEQVGSSLYRETPDSMKVYRSVFDRLVALSLDVPASRRIIEEAAQSTGG